ncbi:ABC transporter ATP-binding protein [Clostridium sp. 19966]|uniref:ABC transporter ATP-binding protein n=1 Tax=Clostridium sp. 19966 TaxID=2768166 RepID=UPI0028DE7272|nr:ABC transporter ATP-binding protein [Clostridium sp. 19966]MDT8718347.1 ABC transporter ATP-binding protein [Clostridium sp. 19966]
MKNQIKMLRWMFSFTKGFRISWGFSRLSPLIFNFFEKLFEALSFKQLFVCFISKNIHDLYLTLIYYLIALAINMIGKSITTYATTYSNAILRATVKGKFVDKSCRLKVAEDEEHSGRMLARLNQDADMACDVLNSAMDNVLIPFLQGLSYLILVFSVSWQIGCFYVITLTPICFLNILFTERFHSVGRRIQAKLAVLNEKFQDTLAGAMVIKLFMLENIMENEVKGLSSEVLAAKKDEQVLRFKYLSIVNVFSHAFSTFPIILGCYLVSIGLMALPNVMFVSRYTYAIRFLANSLITSATDIPRQISGIERIYEIFNRKSHASEYGKLKPSGDSQVMIAFKDIKVHYRGKNVVDGFNFQVEKGKTIALVGPSGSGKSTVVKTVMQFVNYSGDMEILGRSVRDYDLIELRKLISYVPQESMLFDCSIYENILYGNMNATKEQVIEAAKRAYAHDFILALPNGYDTLVGEDGSRLSGGQRQRISIARAFLKNSPILLLDEATSALDLKSEAEIQKAIDELMKGKTILVVAHRLSTIINADTIVVMEDGKIIETGSHEELLSKDGVYKKLYDIQNVAS